MLTDHLRVAVPAVIRLPPAGFRPEDRRAELDDAMTELRGLVDARGDVDGILAGRLRILDQAKWIIDVVAHVDGPANAVLAATDRRAVQVIQSGQLVTVRPARPTALGDQVVRLLPAVSAGYGRSVSLPTEALRKAAAEAGTDPRKLETALQRHGIGRDNAHLIVVMNQDPLHTAQFGVTLTDDNGRRHRGEHVIGWWCNDSGGYLIEEHTSTSGEPWTTISPTDAARLARQIDRLVSRPRPANEPGTA
ncbi:ESAT-6 protein secretion system EspG family protein [Actinocrispum wychmicini]|uniref:ESAT-6 protein secretion system EspG family protein n=1 Tax=Actinocrispum wychmicini TaxID=1213861 RepID=A0A4R2IR74_9PSEU|nr:ESAT-6 protein secretion system EspG family protein [Actinocrispum wychmicini]